MKIINQKIIPCEDCNPDCNDLTDREWCDHCSGVGFLWLRTIELDKPLEFASIPVNIDFDI